MCRGSVCCHYATVVKLKYNTAIYWIVWPLQIWSPCMQHNSFAAIRSAIPYSRVDRIWTYKLAIKYTESFQLIIQPNRFLCKILWSIKIIDSNFLSVFDIFVNYFIVFNYSQCCHIPSSILYKTFGKCLGNHLIHLVAEMIDEFDSKMFRKYAISS